jgi:four helix bundle protein
MTERKNINRGYRTLRVWQDAIDLYVLTSKVFSNSPFELKKSAANILDAAQSISRNIAEGYCRRSLNEYLNFLNYSLSSSGEYGSCNYSFVKAEQITEQDFERLDILHYKVENGLISLIESLEKKLKEGDWENRFVK